ncbi:hypothetical protein AOC36_07585 [Erysipelothrix larvae]|uniref:Uncharacterized protein n=2 Tax=Erysipelothrix larvae TaxID=1514105 RepID=A0A0X8H0I4_9FIRM|nr:hypothetical protein AOC36_07585 [Erysipelothrix larvae]
MRTIKKRHMNIIKKLYYSVTPISTEMLCSSLNVSLRTIRYDMAQVKEILAEIDVELIVKSGVGYTVLNRDKSKLSSIFAFDLSEEEIDERTFRKNTIILTLLVQRRPLSLTQLAHSVYISESSTSKCVHEINEDIKASGCVIEASNMGYMIVGLEHQLRILMTEKIMETISTHYNLLDYYDVLPKQIKQQVSPERFKVIILILDRVNHQFHVWLSQHSFMKLISAIITLEIRINLGFRDNGSQTFDHVAFKSERHYCEFLFEHLFTTCHEESEVWGFISFLVDEGIVVISEEGNTSHVSHILVDEIIEYLIHHNYPIDPLPLADDLRKHINGSIKRQRVVLAKDFNPLLNQVKQQHAEQFELAKRINENVIQKSPYAYAVSEDELSFIAIYLYKNWLKKPELNHPKVYVACASSRGVSKLLETRIKHVFPQIEVLGTLTINQMLNKKRYQDADFIISTIPVKDISIPVIHVTQLLNIKDIEQIQRLLNYGIVSRVMPNTSKQSLGEFLEKQFQASNANTYISVEKLSSVILNILDVLMSLDEKYGVNDQKILGILIHCILAIPRWIESKEVHDAFVMKALDDIETNHNVVYIQFEQVFDLIEQELGVLLNIQERMSFFDYIIERKDGQ